MVAVRHENGCNERFLAKAWPQVCMHVCTQVRHMSTVVGGRVCECTARSQRCSKRRQQGCEPQPIFLHLHIRDEWTGGGPKSTKTAFNDLAYTNAALEHVNNGWMWRQGGQIDRHALPILGLRLLNLHRFDLSRILFVHYEDRKPRK